MLCRQFGEVVDVGWREVVPVERSEDEVLAVGLDFPRDDGRAGDSDEVGPASEGGLGRERRRTGVRAAADDQHLAVVALVARWVSFEAAEVAPLDEKLRRVGDTDVATVTGTSRSGRPGLVS